MIKFLFSFCLLFTWSSLHRVLLVVAPGCAGSCIQVVLFMWVLSLFNTQEGTLSSCIGLWDQCSHSNGAGLDLWFIWSMLKQYWPKSCIPHWLQKLFARDTLEMTPTLANTTVNWPHSAAAAVCFHPSGFPPPLHLPAFGVLLPCPPCPQGFWYVEEERPKEWKKVRDREKRWEWKGIPEIGTFQEWRVPCLVREQKMCGEDGFDGRNRR